MDPFDEVYTKLIDAYITGFDAFLSQSPDMFRFVYSEEFMELRGCLSDLRELKNDFSSESIDDLIELGDDVHAIFHQAHELVDSLYVPIEAMQGSLLTRAVYPKIVQHFGKEFGIVDVPKKNDVHDLFYGAEKTTLGMLQITAQMKLKKGDEFREWMSSKNLRY